jgi:ribosomal protein S25
MPQVSVGILTAPNMTEPTARSVLKALEKLTIVEEITGKRRNRIYVYKKYLSLLEQGADPI